MTDYVHSSEKDFSVWLEDKLSILNISASHLSREIGVDRSTVSLWRKGERTPKAPQKTALAKYFERLKVDGFNSLIREFVYHCHVSEIRRS